MFSPFYIIVYLYLDTIDLKIVLPLWIWCKSYYFDSVPILKIVLNDYYIFRGLQDQLLALVVAQERPDLEEQRAQIVVGIATMKHELKEIQDRILYKLSSSEISPIEDLDFIITLEASKVKSNDIKVGLFLNFLLNCTNLRIIYEMTGSMVRTCGTSDPLFEQRCYFVGRLVDHFLLVSKAALGNSNTAFKE